MGSPALAFAMNNPILNAYVSGVHMRQQAEQQQAANEFAQQQAATQKDQFAQQMKMQQQIQNYYQQHLDAEHELQVQQLNAEKAQREFEVHKQIIPLIAQGYLRPNGQGGQQPDMTNTGMMPSNQSPNQSAMANMLSGGGNSTPVGGSSPAPWAQSQQQPQSQQQQPSQPYQMQLGGQNFNVASPEQMRAIRLQEAEDEAKAAGQKKGAESEAELPSELKKVAAQKQAQMDLENIRQAGDDRRRDSENRNAVMVEQMRANASRDVARINNLLGDGTDPNGFASLVSQAANGEMKLGNDKRSLLIRQHLGATGQVPVDPKVIQDLNKVNSLNTLTDTLQKFVNNNTSSNQIGATVSGALAHLPGSAKGTQEQINGQASIAARDIGEVSRISQPEIQRMIAALPGPQNMDTRANAQAKLDTFNKLIRSKIKDQVLGGIPQEQQDRILARNGFNPDLTRMHGTPDDKSATVSYHGKDVPKYKTDPSDGEVLVFDSSRGGYVSQPKH